ncbi:endoplasmic reticulum junction formation protein lunapark-B isoform X2 [Papilio machaon]|uniref:endoplasmic reticulum junction formation protein lunapark-B isoform X2 n=1 Tax=Papilio machaon TaxID=76193 RepID=UPI001E665C8E|nr:endoplasmic reticulum junction formation protein lunapark-B isoform X2 [Papilio machaon]
MGLILSKLRRKKTTSEILERLEANIKSIERDGHCKEQTHRRVVGYVMAYSVGLYVLLAVLYYYVYVGRSQYWLHSLLYASPLLVLPILVFFIRTTISWYYTWSLNKNKMKLKTMREEKKKILEEVMNTETYKVAKEILDKYGGPEEQSNALKPLLPAITSPNNVNNAPNSAPATPVPFRQKQLALQASTPVNRNMNLMAINNTTTALYKGPRLRSNQLPRPLLDRNRSTLDKVIDYLMKDGPNHRMALICSECFSHNGMAMVEEFEYVSYSCAYCGRLNPARKQRPTAPLLQPVRALLPPSNIITNSGDDSSAESNTSDSEEERRNNVSNTENMDVSECEMDRPPSSSEEEPKSPIEKKED